MGNPLDNKEFRHYLNFIDSFGKVEITEPLGFDAAKFHLKQENDRMARDVTFMMDEESSLEFREGFFEESENEQMLPNGTITNRLTMGYPYLSQEIKDKGFELKVEYILEKNNTEFVTGEVLLEDTDLYEQIKCKIVQQGDRAKAKRRFETKINVFGTEDLDGNPIEPLATENLLLKAKPVVQYSEWTHKMELTVAGLAATQKVLYFNPFRQIIRYGIEDTLGSLYDGFYNLLPEDPSRQYTAIHDISIIRATNEEFSETSVRITDFKMKVYNESPTEADVSFLFNAHNTIGINFFWMVLSDNLDLPDIYDSGFDYIEADSFELTGLFPYPYGAEYDMQLKDFTVTVPVIPQGYRLSIGVFFDNYFPFIDRTRVLNPFKFQVYSGDLNVETTSTGIDTVVKACKYIDYVKKTVEHVNGFDIEAPRYDAGGEFYDRYVFNGNMIRNIVDRGFYTTLKDRIDNLKDLNGDLQFNETKAVIGQYDQFYNNIDNGGFNVVPDDTFKGSFNERYKVINFEYKESYEVDKDEGNTIDDVHSEMQLTTPNLNAENIKKVDIKDIYSVYKISFAQKRAKENTTALENDDSTFIIDTVPLAPNTKAELQLSLIHGFTGNQLTLVSPSGSPFNLMGLTVGQEFFIENTFNVGTYTVVEINQNVLVLDGNPQINYSNISTKFSFFYTGVSLTTRTNEGFDLIEGVLNPENYGNLRYSLKRNIKHYEPYLATCCEFTQGKIKLTFFKNEVPLVTQYNGGEIIEEMADLNIDDLEPAILTPWQYESKIVVPYDEILELFRKYQGETTYGGFIRIQDNNNKMIMVYPREMEYSWVDSTLKIVGEERKQFDGVEITTSGDIITINNVGYNIEELNEVFWEINNDYVKLFDTNYVNLINFVKFDKITINEQSFGSVYELSEALIAING